MATEIVYIDANRQMSKKSDSNHNIWEYQLSDEALVLPAGSQITIQDTFVNKRGAGGQSIEIEDDIDEMVDFGFYVNDSPQWVPLAESVSDPTVEDYEKIYDNGLVPHSPTNNAIRFKRSPANDYMGLSQDFPNSNTHGRAITYFPEKLGGSNTPLPCVMMNGNGGLNSVSDYKNCDIRPFTKEVNIFIPKGVYGLTELSLLITDQMTGKLTNVKNGDYVEDYVKRRLNRPAIIMNQDINENETTYVKRNAIFSAGSASTTENFTQAYAAYGAAASFKLHGCTTRVPVIPPGNNRLIGIPFIEDNIRDVDIIGISQADLTLYTNPPPAPGTNPYKYFQINGEYFSYRSVVPFRNDGAYGDLSYASFRDVKRGLMRGDTAADYIQVDVPYKLKDARAPTKHRRWRASNFSAGPTAEQGPTGVGQLLLTGTEYGRAASGSGRAGDNVNMRFPGDDVGLFTNPESYREMMRDMKMPTTDPRYLTTINRYKASIQLQPRTTPPNIVGDGGIGAESLNYNFGRSFFQVDYMELYRFDDLSRRPQFGDQAKNFDYNPLRRGYFVGTPDLELNWDEAKSSFTFNYLHQSHRIPSHDQYANPIEGDGTEAIEFKRLAQKCRTGSPRVDAGEGVYNQNFVHPSVAGSFENPQRRLGGIMIYNWARKIAQEHSDIDWRNPEVMNQECVGNGPDAYHSGNYLTFEDYFSSPEKAKVAWAKTIWHKLGFSYNQMANPGSYEQERRMDMIPNVANDTKTLDMRLYGMTTTGDMSVSINPTISTTYNDNEKVYHDNEVPGNIRAYNNLDINTPYLPFTKDGKITKAEAGRTGDGDLPGDLDNSKSYFGSMYELMSTALVSTQGRPIQAQNLPILNRNGYLIVNSDIIDTHSDSIKNGQNMCMLGIIPLGTFASQDFITSSNQMVHIVGQTKIVNSIKINIVNPDLTPADLDENSSVIIKIVRPVQQPPHIKNTRVEANNGN